MDTGEVRAIRAVVQGFLHPIDAEDLDDVGDVSSCTAALKRCGAAAVPELIPYINYRSVPWLLGYIGHESAVEPLIAAYKTAGINPVIAALGEIGSSKALPFLQKLLDDPQMVGSQKAWVNAAIDKIERKSTQR